MDTPAKIRARAAHAAAVTQFGPIDDTNVPISRFFETARKWTFQMPKLRQWVESRLEGTTLNLFGGVTHLVAPGYEVIHNEINPELPADIRLDAYDLPQWKNYEGVFETVVFDPPFTAFQAVKTYGLKKAQEVSHARDVVEYVLAPKGRVISLGFNSTGMSHSRGFAKEAILLVNTGASHHDYIAVCERRK